MQSFKAAAGLLWSSGLGGHGVREKESCHFRGGQVSEQVAGEYFVEMYDENHGDTQVSAFARDQGDGYWLRYMGTIEYCI